MGLHRSLLFCVFSLLAGAWGAPAASIFGANGLAVNVLPSGSYTITMPSPGWTFAGGVNYPLSNLAIDSGVDAGGLYSEISFDFVSDAARHAAIRCYQSSRSVLFTATLPSGGPNSFSFPNLTSYPAGLRTLGFAGTFGYPTFQGSDTESPWVAFDAAYHTAILSPASHFMVASTGVTGGQLYSGISTQIAMLPPGFTQQTLLVVEDGINRGFDTWGQLLTGLTGKARPTNDADLTLSHLGYWTDAGSSYYYTTAPGLSYADTLSGVKSAFEKAGVSLGYLQLDSWFYPKGSNDSWTNMSGGIYEYQAASPPFTTTLSSFQNAIGLPLVTHARWIDPASPYQQQFQMSGNVSIDPAYWAQVGNYLATSGVIAFEQDWLFSQASTNYNLTDGDAFLDNMANSFSPLNIGVQYCSGTARHFLQSSKYNNLTTIRTSEDRFNQSRWWNFLYASRLASAVGIWPFTDVFMSSETGNILLATLSAGPVGVGDAINSVNARNLKRAARRDGVIVKPDVPITPLDSSFWNDSNSAQAPLVAATYSDFGDLRAWYFFAYAEGANTQASFHLADAGVTGPVYLYDFFNGAGSVVQPGDVVSLDATGYRYQIAAPLGQSGIAILGDTGHFVSLGKKRITALTDDGAAHVTVAFAKGETGRTLRAYSPVAVAVTATNGRVGKVIYNGASGMLTFRVMPGTGGSATIRLAPADRYTARVRCDARGGPVQLSLFTLLREIIGLLAGGLATSGTAGHLDGSRCNTCSTAKPRAVYRPA